MTSTSSPAQGQNSSIPARAANDGYSPFKVDFKNNKMDYAMARLVVLRIFSFLRPYLACFTDWTRDTDGTHIG